MTECNVFKSDAFSSFVCPLSGISCCKTLSEVCTMFENFEQSGRSWSGTSRSYATSILVGFEYTTPSPTIHETGRNLWHQIFSKAQKQRHPWDCTSNACYDIAHIKSSYVIHCIHNKIPENFHDKVKMKDHQQSDEQKHCKWPRSAADVQPHKTDPSNWYQRLLSLSLQRGESEVTCAEHVANLRCSSAISSLAFRRLLSSSVILVPSLLLSLSLSTDSLSSASSLTFGPWTIWCCRFGDLPGEAWKRLSSRNAKALSLFLSLVIVSSLAPKSLTSACKTIQLCQYGRMKMAA